RDPVPPGKIPAGGSRYPATLCPTMIVFPAIDLKDRKVVRLQQGDYQQVTAYSDDPLQLARQWHEEGAEWIHVVDLDAAKSGIPAHRDLIARMACEVPVKLQVGGGIRSIETARQYLGDGVDRVVVGTRAAQDPDFLGELGSTFPGRVALGLDTRER